MNKNEFFAELCKAASGLPQEDIAERLQFYGEMIDDRVEDGMTEEDAIRAIGTVDEVLAQIVADIPLTKLVKEKITPKQKRKAWEIVLLTLGFPIWGSLLIALFAVVLACYVSVWAVMVSLWSVFAALAVCLPGGVATGVYFALTGNALTGIAMAGAGIVCAGLAIFMFFGCKMATKGILITTKKCGIGLKNCFVKGGKA